MKRTFLVARRAYSVAAIAIAFWASAGCEEKVYRIEEWPRDGKLWRRLTLSRREDGDNGDAKILNDADKSEVKRVARLYGTAAPKIDEKQATFIGTFAQKLPQDVGGDGHYLQWQSPLGGVSIYVERFRGNDDPAATLEARRKTVDQLVNLIVGWFDSELHEEPDWPALRKFLDTTFRHDLQNLSIYGWLAHIAPEPESKKTPVEIPFRVAEYLVERNYATYEAAPELFRELNSMNHGENADAFLTRIRGLLLARASAPADGRLARALRFLNAGPPAWASFQRYGRPPFTNTNATNFGGAKRTSKAGRPPKWQKPMSKACQSRSPPRLTTKSSSAAWCSASSTRSSGFVWEIQAA